jgi:hypothetical protein
MKRAPRQRSAKALAAVAALLGLAALLSLAAYRDEQPVHGVDAPPVSNAEASRPTPAQKVEQTTSAVKQKAGDATITAKVKTALVAAPGIPSRRIDVNTLDGIVRLEGRVDSAHSRERAEAIAQSIAGVRSVENNIDVSAAG